MNIAKRIGLATAGLLTTGALLAPVALADATCTISGNGSGSSNSCTVRVSGGRSCRPNKCVSTGSAAVNNATVRNKVRVRQNTGGNTANGNTGGSVSIDTGNNSVEININNDVNN